MLGDLTATAALSVVTVTSLAEAEALSVDWRRLETEAGPDRAVFFQSFDWCLFVWRTLAAVSACKSIQPRVVVVRSAGHVVAIWPLAIKISGAGRFAQDLTAPYAQYSDALISRDSAAGPTLDAAYAEVLSWRIDGLLLRKVRRDSALGPWLRDHGKMIGTADAAPAVQLSAFSSFEHYRASLNAKTRKNLRNSRNRVARVGKLIHTVATEATERSRLVGACYSNRSAWLDASGLSSQAFCDPAFAAIIRGLADGRDGAPPTTAMHLGLLPNPTAEETAPAPVDISLHWGFEHNGRYYAFMAAKNPAYDEFSPGRLHLEDVVSACAGRGLATVDFLAPAMAYKQTLATSSVVIEDFGIPFTARGRAMILGWHGVLRPALKSAMLALPAGFRRWMVPHTARPPAVDAA